MKRLFLLTLLFSLMLHKVSAQTAWMFGSRKTALKYIGKYVYVYDSVKSVKIINSSKVYLRIRIYSTDRGVIIILTGKGADKEALSLKNQAASFTGWLHLVNGEPTMFVSNFKKIGGGTECKCQAGDPYTDVNIDTLQHQSIPNP